MRRLPVFVVLGAAGLLALSGCQKKSETAATGDGAPAAATAPAGPISPPKRKPGLWAQTMTGEGMNQTVKICLDADTDAKMSLWGNAVGKNMCAKNVITPVPGGWKFESECDMGASGRNVSSGTATGDFNSKYTVKVSSTTTGASMAQANGTHEMTLAAAWEGPCPAGMKGGDMNINGMVINMEKMTATPK